MVTDSVTHHGGVLYGTELCSVILKRVGLFCFPIKYSTHTGDECEEMWVTLAGFCEKRAREREREVY